MDKIRIGADRVSRANSLVTPKGAIGPPLLPARQAWFVGER